MKNKLTKEEKEILDSYERDEWKESLLSTNQIKKFSEYAKATNLKNKRVNIRISQKDLEQVQKKAIEEGLPYQTLISSLLHKYISGRLVDQGRILIKK